MTNSSASFDSMYCNVCLVAFSGLTPAQQHYSSERHRKKAMIAKLANEREGDKTNDALWPSSKVFCKICNISCDTKQMLDEHELTLKHLDAYEKRRNHMKLNETASEFIILPALWQPDISKLTAVTNTSNRNNSGDIADYSETSEDAVSTPAFPFNSRQPTNSELSSLHSEPIRKLCNDSDVEKEYEFSAVGRGTCYACNVDLTSVRMTKEHIRGQKHQNAKMHWLTKRQCELRSKRNTDQQNGTCSTSVSIVENNPFSAALGIADPVFPSYAMPPGAYNEQHIAETRTQPGMAVAQTSDITVISSTRKKQSPSDKTTWLTCKICIKKLNSEKMLKAHMRTHPSAYIEMYKEEEVCPGIEEQARVLNDDLNSSVFQEAIEGVKDSKESMATARRKEHVGSAFGKLKIYARDGDV